MTCFEVSVIVPVYQGRRWISRCLKSLVSQELEHDRFQVVLVFNGADDGSIDLAESFITENPTFQARTIFSKAENASQARNDGIKNADGKYITFLDVDDCISRNYLQTLLASSAVNRMAVAQIANIEESGNVDRCNLINNDLFLQETATVNPTKFPRALTFMTAKMFPTEWARECLFEENLRSGEDVAFYGKLLSKYDFSLALLPAMQGSTYYRQLVPTSVSRGRAGFGFLVEERALVIRSLSRSALGARADKALILQSFMRSQASFIRKYAKDNPNDYQKIADFVSTLNVVDFPWANIQPPVEDLAVCYNFAPYSDTGANVAAKRMRESGYIYDVISQDMSNVRTLEPANNIISAPYVSRHIELSGNASFANGGGALDFVIRGLASYKNLVKSGRTYARLYSRSMWPASHFLAAAIKVLDPSLEWTAEFSDPIRITTSGDVRTAPVPSQEMIDLVVSSDAKELIERLVDYPDLFAWTELIPFFSADNLVFTNENQLKIMKNLYDAKVGDIIDFKATVSHHPTLPRSFYEIKNAKTFPGVTKVNLAYFGEFYNTRGLSEIADALVSLHEAGDASCVLHVYSSGRLPEKYDKWAGSAFVQSEKMSYLDFLATLDSYDCLIVNDARTSDHHPVNPYLPSKYADYVGSNAPIWSVVEKGSVLSGLTSRFKTELGDEEAAKLILQKLSSKL